MVILFPLLRRGRGSTNFFPTKCSISLHREPPAKPKGKQEATPLDTTPLKLEEFDALSRTNRPYQNLFASQQTQLVWILCKEDCHLIPSLLALQLTLV